MADKDLTLIEGLSTSYSLNSKTDLYSKLTNLAPSPLKENETDYWINMVDTIAHSTDTSLMDSNVLLNFYDSYNLNNDNLNKISKMYGLSTPLEYSTDKLAFLLKYYPFYLRLKGSINALGIISIIDRNENDYYLNHKENEIEIKYIDRGYYSISRTGLKSVKFAQSIINKLTRCGVYYEVTDSIESGDDNG